MCSKKESAIFFNGDWDDLVDIVVGSIYNRFRQQHFPEDQLPESALSDQTTCHHQHETNEVAHGRNV